MPHLVTGMRRAASNLSSADRSGLIFSDQISRHILLASPLAGVVHEGHAGVMDLQYCMCGKRVRRPCGGAEGPIALIHVYYCVRPGHGEEVALEAVRGLWCLGDAVATDLLTADWFIQGTTQPVAQESRNVDLTAETGPDREVGDDENERIREAVATYLTDRIDQALDGGRLDRQLWASSGTFLPAAAAKALTQVNLAMSDGVSTVLAQAFAEEGTSTVVADALSGVGGDLILASVSKPLGEARQTIEIVGLCLAVLTMQPALAVACAKAFLHDQITRSIENSIVKALDPTTAMAEIKATEGTAEVTDVAAPETGIDSPASTDAAGGEIAEVGEEPVVAESAMTELNDPPAQAAGARPISPIRRILLSADEEDTPITSVSDISTLG